MQLLILSNYDDLYYIVQTIDNVFFFMPAMQYRFHTPDKYDYEQVVSRSYKDKAMVFKVRACNDAHIALFDHYHTDLAYEIIFGGGSNTYTWIRKYRLEYPVASVTTPNITSCDEYR